MHHNSPICHFFAESEVDYSLKSTLLLFFSFILCVTVKNVKSLVDIFTVSLDSIRFLATLIEDYFSKRLRQTLFRIRMATLFL